MIKKKSLISIDILRAMAALGVYLYHLHAGIFIAKYTGLLWLNNLDSFGAEYAVPLFFLISGYCIHLSNIKYLQTHSKLPLKEYYKRRFLRIYPPYLIILLITMAINGFTYTYLPSLTDVGVHLLALQGFTTAYFTTINVVLWTISIEIGFYIIYPVFYMIRLKYSLDLALLISFLVTCISIAFFITKPVTSPQRFCVFNLWFAWCCGAYIADKYTFDNKSLYKPIFIAIYLFIALAAMFIPNNFFLITDQLHIIIWAAPLLLMLSIEDWLNKHYNIFIKTITNIGLSSYSLYLIHDPLILLKNYLAHKFLPAPFQFAGLTIGIFIIPLIAWYSFRYFEKPFLTKKRSL